ncbi:MAG: helix-turn-helix domain-containing protein [Armatimonadota bacterium]
MVKPGMKFIGVIPIDHSIEIVVPERLASDDLVDGIKADFAGWFNRGAVSYRAKVVWQEGGAEEVAVTIRTHGSDVQMKEHASEMHTLVDRLEAELHGEFALVIDRPEPQPIQSSIFSTEEAAEYLQLSVQAVKYHVYTAGDLKAVKIGPTLAFFENELERFKSTPRPKRGRPKRTE